MSAKIDACLFCGNQHFYYEAPFSLPLLKRDLICYVCEARYKTARASGADAKYRQLSHDEARRTPLAARWRERVESLGSDG